MNACHDVEARREAAVSRWEPATPPDELLRVARAPEHRHEWVPVQGPHLRRVHARQKRNRLGVPGISLSTEKRTGRRSLYVNLGKTNRRFSVETLGATEAWRRALQLRAEYERRVAAANAQILAARARQTTDY